MSTTKTTKTADDRVEVNIQRGGDREDPNLFVAVNGVNYLCRAARRAACRRPWRTRSPAPNAPARVCTRPWTRR